MRLSRGQSARLVVADPVRAGSLIPEMLAHRKPALELAPDNPRVIMMDAGLLFYAPGGSQDRALARWNEAIRIFERREQREVSASPLPDWGGALAYGWLANLYLSTSPPRMDAARQTAERALQMRPDFWWLRSRVLPRIAR